MKTLVILFFCFLQQQAFALPVINSFAPESGPVGTSVIISGTGFSSTATNNIVFFGAEKANVISATALTLTVSVPTGATYQPITVTTGGLIGYSKKPFMVTYAGGGAFSASNFSRLDFATSHTPAFTVLKDLDADEKPDLVYSTLGLTVNKNTSTPGNLSFGPNINLAGSQFGNYMSVEDLDGDGKPDIVVAEYGLLNYYVYKNQSTPGVIAIDPPQILTAAGVYGLAITDLDGDGKPDIATTNNETNGILIILRNTSSGGVISFAASPTFTTGRYPRGVSFGYINNDNKPDLVVANQSSTSISVFINNSTPGSISFAPKVDFTMPAGSHPEHIAVGDLDGDGKPDLAVTGNDIGANVGTISVFMNTGIGAPVSFAPALLLTTGTGWNPYHVEINDINGDGKPDLAVINQFNTAISLFKNNSTPGILAFDPKSDLTQPANVSRGVLFIGDADGDNLPDLLTGSENPDIISIFHNNTAAVPVRFSAFTATAIGKDVLLNWHAENETAETDRYEAERSTDGIHFVKIATVAKKTNGLSSNSYEFTDPGIVAEDHGVIYYRIKQVDVNGRSIYSTVKSINSGGVPEVNISPNPVKDILSVRVNLLSPGDILFVMYDAAGKESRRYHMQGNKGNNLKAINMKGLPAGTYLLKVYTGITVKALEIIKTN